MSEFQQQLNQLRQSIDAIDKQLVDLLTQRLAITAKVGELKQQQGVAVYDPEREQQLIQQRREQALNNGVSPELVEDILRRIMRDSYISQQQANYQCVNPDCGKVVIIGGAGQLGSVFVRLFKASGYTVEILETADWPKATEILADAQLVIVAVPIHYTAKVIQQLAGLPENCILADLTSVKQTPLYEMMKIHKGPVVGLHPMFGPDVSSLIKQTIIVCDGQKSEAYHWLLAQFKVWGAKLYHTSAAEHDKTMSLVQVMRHFSTIAYGYHLMMEGADIEQLVEMSSPIYRLELIMVGRLFAQDPVLYTDIIFSNQENVEMMKRFAYRFLELLEDVQLHDKSDFIAMFEKVAAWFGDYASLFLSESKLMLEKANELKR